MAASAIELQPYVSLDDNDCEKHLASVLENLVDGNVVNQISVDSDIASNARIALQRMLDI